jgi:undecaprenyl phosphate N,N'-diacetylbacillosamine 1-phosphate transferase
MIQKCVKKIADFLIALIVLVILIPLFLFVALLIKLDSKGSVFFRQKRVGRNGKVFKIWKFRTMVERSENIGLGIEVSKNDPRITKVGNFLRRFGIDELPQVINIVFGQMSLVGPRAALPFQFEKYSELERRRVLMKPGITNINILKGWNTSSWKERIEWDIWYIENWSLLLDLKILLITPFVVLSGKGQYGKDGTVKDYE